MIKFSQFFLVCPVKLHAFIKISQTNVCPHGVTAGFCQLCWNIKNQAIINCTHKWFVFSSAAVQGTQCDFGSPAQTVVCYSCHICHAMACTGCAG